MSRYRAISLFSNCGAGDIGYRDAGFRFDVMAEIDERRIEVCLSNHPGAVGVPGDLRQTWPRVIEAYRNRAGSRRPALLCACPPCQGMSSARSGKGKYDDADAGSRDDRNLLVTVIANVALSLKPSLVVVENVQAFFNRRVKHPDDGEPVSAANYLIAELSVEYIVFPIVTDLCDFGIPQSRKRAFLTFVRRDIRGVKRMLRQGRVPFPRPTHGVDGSCLPPISISEALSTFDLPSLDAATVEGATSEEYSGFHSVPKWGERTYAMVAAIPPGSGRSAWQNTECEKCGPVDVTENDATCPHCDSPLLRPVVQESDGSFRLVNGFKTSYRRMSPNRPAATITTASGRVGSDNTIHPTQNRLLSALECALLQTFPEDFQWSDAMSKWGHTKVRDMIGEAVPPAFTRMHGEILMGILRGEWCRAPLSINDDRIMDGWKKLILAAVKDCRRSPNSYVDYLSVEQIESLIWQSGKSGLQQLSAR